MCVHNFFANYVCSMLFLFVISDYLLLCLQVMMDMTLKINIITVHGARLCWSQSLV